MAVYARCRKCSCRRDRCQQQMNHKRFLVWVAEWTRSRTEGRLEQWFGPELENPKELAEACYRGWKTDQVRGELKIKPEETSHIKFSSVADEWWTRVVIGQRKIADPKRSELSRFNSLKKLFGEKLIAKNMPEEQNERKRFLTLEDTEQWIMDRIEAGIAVNTINRDVKPLRWILDYAVAKGYATTNPIAGMSELKGGNIRVRWMSEDEVELLTQAAYKLGDMELVDVIAIGINTGFRKGNLERLAARDIGPVFVTAVKTKSGDPYDVPVSENIASILRRLSKSHLTGPILDTVKLDPRYRAAARLAGLYPAEEVKDGKKDPTKVTIHTMRHTFAALYLKRCANPKPGDPPGDIHKLSKLMGHASVKITESVYGHLCPKDMAAQASLLGTAIAGADTARLKAI